MEVVIVDFIVVGGRRWSGSGVGEIEEALLLLLLLLSELRVRFLARLWLLVFMARASSFLGGRVLGIILSFLYMYVG